jgi:hypothetical protein
MSDATIFVIVFCGLFVLRIIAATIFFYYILPLGDHCPYCDSATLRMQPTGWDRLVPFLRSSWCIECGWHGLLRPEPRPLAPQRRPAQSKRTQHV